jgi:hypothetical protein
VVLRLSQSDQLVRFVECVVGWSWRKGVICVAFGLLRDLENNLCRVLILMSVCLSVCHCPTAPM